MSNRSALQQSEDPLDQDVCTQCISYLQRVKREEEGCCVDANDLPLSLEYSIGERPVLPAAGGVDPLAVSLAADDAVAAAAKSPK